MRAERRQDRLTGCCEATGPLQLTFRWKFMRVATYRGRVPREPLAGEAAVEKVHVSIRGRPRTTTSNLTLYSEAGASGLVGSALTAPFQSSAIIGTSL